jgi:hypothetical protein
MMSETNQIEFDLEKALNILPIGKVRKKDIVELLDEIIDSKSVSPKILHHLIGICLRYYSANPKKITNNHQWVLQACSRDGIRKHLRYPWVFEPYICASDGHRIHLILDQDETLIEDKCFVSLIKETKVKISIPAEPPPAEHFLKIKKRRDDFQLLKLSETKYKDEKTIEIPFEKNKKIHVDQRYIRETFAMDSEMLFSPGDGRDVLIFESTDHHRICFLTPLRY